ncbi:ATP-grasp domain-containing protein [Aedoeadaptatus urinae]|uniref:ATP-grasp domain-containing protein n=1 Tax=Aedoeadaptatus urinae TaxID=1871017 RepID=UPI00097DC14C|nr:RimK family alpha-L-glutamate ligase [Peptoniphilus urinae]
MIHIIYHGYFSFAIHRVVQDLINKGRGVLAKPHTDYILEADKNGIVARDLKRDPAPDAYLFFDKDVRLAKALEKKRPVFNSAEAIALADDKISTYTALAPFLPMVDTVPAPFHYRREALKENFLDYVETRFDYPMVIKAAKGSFGEQVYLAKNRDEAQAIAETMAGDDFLFQPFIAESAGVDRRVLLIGGEIVGAIERRNERDFRANIAAGSVARPIELTEEEKTIALAAHKRARLAFSGIDLIESEKGPLLVEINSNMSYLGFQEATGIDVSRKLLAYVNMAAKRA